MHSKTHGPVMHVATPDRALWLLSMDPDDTPMGSQCLSFPCGVTQGTKSSEKCWLHGHCCSANMPLDRLYCLAHA